jgi:hypothetical protein
LVELATLQAVSYIMGSLGVFVAAVYYILNMRETTKNRRAALTNNLMQFLTSVERNRIGLELLTMNWKDFDDFYKKYDSTVNPDNYAKRMSFWSYYEILGVQYRNGILDMETIYAVSNVSIINNWMHFKPIIEEYRKLDYGKDFYKNWESMANDLARIKTSRDPSWKGSKSHIKPEEYDHAFKV